MSAADDKPAAAPIAIVGIGCRFPGGANDPASFWQLLIEGRDAIGEIPRDRIDMEHFYDARPATPGRIMTRRGGFLERLEEFDADFFGISPREAERMDPQQRLLLETAWEALEDAGQDVNALSGSTTGVFVGQWVGDFENRLFSNPDAVDFPMTLGSGRYAASGRISYAFGLRGACLTVDAACSAGLSAIHLAVRSIRSGESTLALAGGVNVILQPHIHIAYSQSKMMAPDGRCKFGDASGDGYVRSEGAGMIVLKRLDRALADGDRIYAVIRGSAVNSDGNSSGSMGRPSRIGQEELLRTAYADAGISPGQVAYVEAHGTGTRAGDPVELGALATVLVQDRPADRRAFVGSIKTNFGHTEAAAGVAGLIKAALTVHHGVIPPSLHFRTPNPNIPWATLPFAIPTAVSAWPAGLPRVAGVSAYGIGGTNAHVVLEGIESARAAEQTSAGSAPLVLPLSARSTDALRALAGRYAARLEAEPALDARTVCRSAALRRSALEHRAAFVAANRSALIEALAGFAGSGPASAEGVVHSKERPKVAFVVPGQGAQWTGMARQLAACEPEFLRALDECDAAARRYVSWSIVEQLNLDPGADGYLLDRIDVIQPVLVAMAIAYAAWLRSRGVQPDAVVGHSMGEVGAAYLAGVLDLDAAMRIICRRSALMKQTSGQGAMAMIDLPMADAEVRIGARQARVGVAVSNSPRSCVISGDPAAVKEILAECERDGVFCRLVKVDVASHSPQMDAPAAALAAELKDLKPAANALPIYSTVLARTAEGSEFDAAYWGRNMRQPVRFTGAVNQLVDAGVSVFVELGPHPVLLPAIQQTAQSRDVAVSTVAFGRRDEAEQVHAMAVLAGLWTAGVPIDWKRNIEGADAYVSLPSYPWQRERHWTEAAQPSRGGGRRKQSADNSAPGHPMLGAGTPVGGAAPGVLWDTELAPARDPYLLDHRLHGMPVLAASVYLELAFGAQREQTNAEAVSIRNLRFERPLHIDAEQPIALQLQWLPRGECGAELVWYSPSQAGWVRNASGEANSSASAAAVVEPLAAIQARCPASQAGSDVYRAFEARGVVFGATLQSIEQIWMGKQEVLARLKNGEHAVRGRRMVPPAMLDACFQAAVAACPADGLWLPTAIKSATRLRVPGSAVWVHALVAPAADDSSLSCDVRLFDEQGLVVELSGVRLEQLGASTAVDPRRWLYEIGWQELPAATAAASENRRWLLLAGNARAHDGLTAALMDAIAGRKEHSRLLSFDELKSAQGLQAEIAAAGAAPVEILDLRALELPAFEACAADESLLSNALHGLAELARTVAPLSGKARVHALTRNARAIDTQERARLAPAQAAVWGVGATLAVEHGDIWAGCLDIDAAEAAGIAVRAVIEHAREAGSGDAAVRGGKRYAPRLRRLEDEKLERKTPVQFRTDASYLLTGGLGGVGIHVARWLIQQGARRLVILGRTALPERARWKELDAVSAAGVLVANIRALEASGASIHYASVDVGDEAALRGFLQQFTAEGWPALRGVIHAAGITDDRLIAQVDRGSWQPVLHGKAFGAWHLHRLLPDVEVFAMFSSVAALLPEPGQASYAAANSVLDALAQLHRTLSIGWGVWTGLGVMKGEAGRHKLEQLERRGLSGFRPEAALQAFSSLLGSGLNCASVLPADWPVFAQAHAGREPALVREQTAAVSVAGSEAAPAAAQTSDPAERRKRIEQGVREAVARVLKLQAARIDPRKPLGAMGLSSLMAMELRNRLETVAGRPLSATLAWNYPTVDALVAFLAGERSPAEAPKSAAEPAPAAPPAQIGAIAELSDEDAALLLRRRR